MDPAYPTYKEPLTQHPNLNGFSQFGFGRRTCQGVPIVEQDLFLAMGGLAWAFDLCKKRRADGSVVDVHWNDFTPLLIAKPAPFEFEAFTRSPQIARRVDAMWESGKGADDDEAERLSAALEGGKHDDDVLSVGGSDTSSSLGSNTDSDLLLGSVKTPSSAASDHSGSEDYAFPRRRAARHDDDQPDIWA